MTQVQMKSNQSGEKFESKDWQQNTQTTVTRGRRG